jgi:hypothetical protein
MLSDDAANHIIQSCVEYKCILSCLLLNCKGFHLSSITWVLKFFTDVFYAWWKGTMLLTNVSLARHKTFTLSSWFTHYVTWKIVSGRYSADVIINIDETNVDLDLLPRTMWCRIGERSVKACISRHFCRQAVGIKLPALVIWKGEPMVDLIGSSMAHCTYMRTWNM